MNTSCFLYNVNLLQYDTWGNSEDGWEVNNVFRIDSMKLSDQELNDYGKLKNIFGINDELNLVEYGENRIEIEDEEGKPLGAIDIVL